MTDLEQVRHFLKNQERAYREFLTRIRAGCDAVADELGGQVVLRVYDRTDKQGGEALKDAAKVLEAVGRPVRNAAIRKLGDIIGVTVVVQYPDQAKLVLDRLKEVMSSTAVEEKRKAHAETYFATHATYRSTDLTHGNILCEVQCKTVLHDAWSAKMHDLTYKPLGSMDPRMKGMIEAISATLEGLEQQSRIARDMIVSRQRGERKPFQTSLKAFLSSVEGALFGTGGEGEHPLAELRAEVVAFSESGDTERGRLLNGRLLEAIERPEESGSAWLLAVRFASCLPDGQAVRFLTVAADILFDNLVTLREADQISEPQVRAIPLGFYSLQDFARALEYGEKLIGQADELKLTEEGIAILRFNRATWLLERESLRPSKPNVAGDVREEVDQLLELVRPVLGSRDDSEFKDTTGLRLIVFGETKEEVRRGIDLCLEAGHPVPGDDLETAVALAFAEWRTHVGWRRYFEIAEKES